MPTNKNAQLRYQILDRCFSNRHKRYEIQDLVDKVNESMSERGTEVSLRQIRKDIQDMRDMISPDAEILAVPYDGKKCYYTYDDPDYSIYKTQLSQEEMAGLQTTIEMLRKYLGPAENAWLEEVLSNLEYRLGVKPNANNAVAFEQNRQLHGLEHLSEIIDAAVNRQPLNLLYKTYGGRESECTIHPYHVRQYNSRWYLFGLEVSDHGSRIANRALDRIVKCSKADVPFIENITVDFGTYFNDFVGVTVPDNSVQLEKVILKFDPERFPYIKSKPIHTSQAVLSEEDCTVQIKVRPNRELESLIFSFGPQVEVIKPQWFRSQIAEKIKKNSEKYFSMQKDCTEGPHLCSR